MGAKQNVNKHDRKLHVKIFAADRIERTIVAECASVLFHVKYGTGKSGCMFTQNLYKASNRDGSRGEVLALMCENIGVIFMKSQSLSERVCHPCSRKIRNLCKLFVGIKTQPATIKQKWEQLQNAAPLF